MPLTSHFDVIVYDQIEAPTLWIETNKDKSEDGRTRIVPAEFVRAIIEVKSAFNSESIRAASRKLGELKPLMAGSSIPGEPYPLYLPEDAALAMLFFEIRTGDSSDCGTLRLLRDLEFARFFYGALILRGEGLDPDCAGLVQNFNPGFPIGSKRKKGGLLSPVPTSASRSCPNGHNLAAMLSWAPLNFSKFAFDLLALLNGTFGRGLPSSFHGFDFGQSISGAS